MDEKLKKRILCKVLLHAKEFMTDLFPYDENYKYFDEEMQAASSSMSNLILKLMDEEGVWEG